MEKANLNCLRAIKTVKDISTSEFAKAFGVTTAYINALENSERKIKIQTLKYGLDNLNISLEDYHELEEFGKLLSNSDFNEEKKYLLFLIKAISITKKELSEEAELTLSKHIKNNTKNYKKEIDKKIKILQNQIDLLNAEKEKIK